MQLTSDDIRELQEIWKRSCGETITDAEASEVGARLIDLFLILAEHNQDT